MYVTALWCDKSADMIFNFIMSNIWSGLDGVTVSINVDTSKIVGNLAMLLLLLLVGLAAFCLPWTLARCNHQCRVLAYSQM